MSPITAKLRSLWRSRPRFYYWLKPLKTEHHDSGAPERSSIKPGRFVIWKADMQSAYRGCKVTRFWIYTRAGGRIIEWGDYR